MASRSPRLSANDGWHSLPVECVALAVVQEEVRLYETEGKHYLGGQMGLAAVEMLWEEAVVPIVAGYYCLLAMKNGDLLRSWLGTS